MMIDYEQYNDTELIGLLKEKCKSTDKAFNVLYKRYSRCLHTYCSIKCDRTEDVQDLVQDIWINFLHAVNECNNPIQLPAYLYGIAQKRYAMKFRTKNSKIQISNVKFDINDIISPFDMTVSLENKDLVSMIKLATNNLSEKNKDIFVLKWFTGLTNREIADILDESLDNIKQRSSRAMKEVMKILKPVTDEIKQKS